MKVQYLVEKMLHILRQSSVAVCCMKMECVSAVGFTIILLIALKDLIAYIHCEKLYCKAAGRQIFVSAK
jgi:hypothetical protein